MFQPPTTPEDPPQGSSPSPRAQVWHSPMCQGLTLAQLSRRGSSCHLWVLPPQPRGCSGLSPALAEQFHPQLGSAHGKQPPKEISAGLGSASTEK